MDFGENFHWGDRGLASGRQPGLALAANFDSWIGLVGPATVPVVAAGFGQPV